MEIRPILSAMLRNRTGALLITLQIAVTLAVVVNATHMINQRLAHIDRPTGIDVDNLITVHTIGFGEQYQAESSIRDDLALLRAIPQVRAAAQVSAFPLSGSGSASGFRDSAEEDANNEPANYYFVDEHAMEAFGVKLAAGRNFTPTEIMSFGGDTEVPQNTFPAQVIVTKPFADNLFPDQEPLGKLVYTGLGEAAEIVGIVEHMHGAWVGWGKLDQVMLQPKRSLEQSIRYIVRVEPGATESLVPVIEEQLTQSNRTRIVRRVLPLSEMAARSYSADRAMAIVLTVVVVLLLAVTALGIVGLASFSVRQRTKQIGTRRAIGARQLDILRYFMLENWLMTTIGVIVGTALAIGLNYWLVNQLELERLDLIYVPTTILGIWLLGLLAVLGPARRAARISPAVATRTV